MIDAAVTSPLGATHAFTAAVIFALESRTISFATAIGASMSVLPAVRIALNAAGEMLCGPSTRATTGAAGGGAGGGASTTTGFGSSGTGVGSGAGTGSGATSGVGSRLATTTGTSAVRP